jgi:hypothetical protein
MTIQAPSSTLTESLDYGHSLEFSYFLVPDAGADALEALAGHLHAHLEHEERSIAATARRLPDVQPSKVADGDLATEDDQQ